MRDGGPGRGLRLLAAAVVAALMAACASVGGWSSPELMGDLPQDRAISTGRLDNGMRWIVLRTDGPSPQAAMRLVIDAGSMHEDWEAGESGAAHLLEHMAFRGSRHFPDGEMQRRLGAMGLAMGRDANASTGPDTTIYTFDMPRADAEALAAGLAMSREIADRLLLDPGALEIERGVVLAEERALAGPEQEKWERLARAQVGMHPYARPVIGARDSIAAMPVGVLRRFYQRHYRPERATLVVAGPVDAGRLERMIAAQFGDWRGRGRYPGRPARDPEPVKTRPEGDQTQVIVLPGLGDAQMLVEWWEPFRRTPPTRVSQRAALTRQMWASALAQRMPGLNEAGGQPARTVTAAQSTRIAGVWAGSMAQALGVDDAAATARLLTDAHRQAVEHGITQGELDRAKAIRLDAARRAAVGGRTGSPSQLADQLARAALNDAVLASPADTLALVEQQLASLTLDEVNADLRARLGGEARLVFVGPEAPAGGRESLAQAFAAALAARTEPYAPETVKPWPYADFGAPGAVVERREAADLGLTFVRFANGLKLTVKPTPFEPGRAHARLSFGLGRIGLPRHALTASDFGIQVWSEGGLGKLTRVEQGQVLAGKSVQVLAGARDDAWMLSAPGVATPDLRLQFQLMAAMMSDPAYRADAWDAMMSESDRAQAGAASTPARAMAHGMPALLHGGDVRWTSSTAEMRARWTADDAIAFMAPIVAQAPMSLLIVGDVDVETVIAHAAATLGALSPRTEAPEPPGLRDVRFPEGGARIVLRHEGRADQGALAVAWPTETGLLESPRDYRLAWVMGQILADRATLLFRSAEGATYAPVVSTEFSRVLPGFGYVSLTVELPPERIDAAFAQIDALARELAEEGVSEDELRRAVGPRLESGRRQKASSNVWWLSHLDGAFGDVRVLEMIRSQENDHESIKAADVRAAAARWLVASRALRVKAVRE